MWIKHPGIGKGVVRIKYCWRRISCMLKNCRSKGKRSSSNRSLNVMSRWRCHSMIPSFSCHLNTLSSPESPSALIEANYKNVMSKCNYWKKQKNVYLPEHVIYIGITWQRAVGIIEKELSMNFNSFWECGCHNALWFEVRCPEESQHLMIKKKNYPTEQNNKIKTTKQNNNN